MTVHSPTTSSKGLFYPSTTRKYLFFVISTTAFFLILFTLHTDASSSDITFTDAFRSQESFRHYINHISPLRSSCPSYCPSDPYAKPGMLYWSPDGDVTRTRWLPFPSASEDWEPHENYTMAQVPKEDNVPYEAFQEAGAAYTAQLHGGAGVEDDAEWDWLRDRTILLIGSSHDRNNVEQFCDVVGGKRKSWGWHIGGFCHVERLNLTLTNWFLYGMIDDENNSFPPQDAHPNTFEKRIEDIILPLARQDGVDQKPDLVLSSSLFWDENFMYREGVNHRNRGKARGFLWTEIAWQRSRVRKLFKFVREMHGQDIPLMFRTRHVRLNMSGDKLLNVAQLDQSGRAAAKDSGVKLFTWGDKLEGYHQYTDKDQHFKTGPNTYLFGDMVLFHLRQAITPGCWSCNE